MYIDLSELKNKKHGRKELNLEICKEYFNDNGEIVKFLRPIKFNGSVRYVDGIFDLTGKAETEVLLACSRCNDSFSKSISIDIKEKLSDTINNDDAEIILIDIDKLNLYQIIENSLVLELPVKRLCSESCKGLCQQCGTNLNSSECKCNNEDIDPRLAKLKELFSNS
ncbi:YceD family protein [Clostridium ihumii]|uniref:YceD family protein n=1 Tax=Clostridium ihumii TaxID=1470356 RepID=UPI00058D5CCA|nr:DUF177 domain-containing protein [Clostridium ihumii]